ncbi:MAG: sigma 54-interacting transcriptional regulator [Myxococcales bacterium]
MHDVVSTAPITQTLPIESSAAAPDTSRAYLLVHDGGVSRVFFLPPGAEVTVGRSPAATLRSENPSVSRLHAKVRVVNGHAYVVDLGSHNGTRVNGERFEGERLLQPADIVSVGNLTLVYQERTAPKGQPARLEAAEWRKRIPAELERSRRNGSSFVVAAVELGTVLGDVTRVASEQLRSLDSFCLEGKNLLILLPELSFEDASVPIERLLRALHLVAPNARAGFASCPADGVDPDALVKRARDAAQKLSRGELSHAVEGAILKVGDREIVAAAPAMIQLYTVIRRLARSDIPVLVHGETGSGKENAAYALHHWSPRHAQKMLTVNCAALPEQLIESELFGYERGAFSGADRARAGLFEAANGGTLFLDEVGELSAQAQAKLLRAVENRRISRLGSSEEREIDVRLVAATNRSLEGEIKAGRFRQDLFFRLSAATVSIPPLRSRPQDLLLLARRFLEQACAALGKPVPAIAPATLRLLGEHGWPGNVRELKNAMDYLAATVTEPVLEPGSLPPSIVSGRPIEEPKTEAPLLGDLYEEIRQLEKRRISEALEAAGGVQVKAAELIGMPLRTFAGKVRLYGLHRK